MKRPLGIVALCYVAGILCGEYSALPVRLLFILSFLLLGLSFAFAGTRPQLLLATLFFAGWTNLTARTLVLSPHDLRLQLGDETKEVSIRGAISDALSERRYERNGEESWRTLARIDVSEIRTNANWQPAYGKLLVSTSGALGKNYSTGEKVEINGIIHKPNVPIAEGLFDYRTFLQRQGIYYQLDAHSPTLWKNINSSLVSRSLGEHFFDWAQQSLHYGLGDEDQSLRLLWAMTLGWKAGLTDEVSEPFMRSGTMHVFAISGLHIALIAGILVALLRVIRVPRGVCGLIVIPLIWFYTSATGWQPSAIRSTVMMTIVIAGWSLRRPVDLLNSLGAAAFIILLWDPQQLFQASFQLSFFVVLSIALLQPSFEKMRSRLLRHDPFLPDELRPRWQRWLDIPIRWISTLFVTSVAAWLGSLPLVAYYFHLITPVSLLANMIIVPLSSLALMANLGSLICASWLPWLTEIFNASGWFFMSLMVATSEWFATAPGAYFHVRAPSLLGCVVYYAVLFTLFAGWFLAAGKRRLWILSTITLLGLAWLWNWNNERNTWRLTILPLAGGETVFVDAPRSEEQLLIDCGNDNSVDFVTKPFLRAQGVNRLNKLLLTHGDLKNMGGAESIIADFKVSQVFSSPVRFRSHAYRILQDKLDASPNLKRELQSGNQFGIWQVLHPAPDDKFPQADDGPLVLKGRIERSTVLLLSDLSRDGQNLLSARNSDLRADIVIAGIPRDSEPLNDALIKAIQPKLMVITDCEFPATERASIKVRARLEKHGIPVLYCRDRGAISLKISDGGCEVFAHQRRLHIFPK